MKLNEKNIILSSNAKNRNQALEELSILACELGIHNNKIKLLNELKNREKISSTGMESGFAIPHAIGTSKKAGVLIVKYNFPISDWKTFDGSKVKVAVALFMNKEKASKDQINILSSISKMLIDEKNVVAIKEAKTKTKIIDIFNNFLSKDKVISNKVKSNKDFTKVVAVTSCASGIAHTYMAAEALEKYAKIHNVKINVEKQGSSGIEDKLSEQQIKEADYVIIAADLRIKEISRFNRKKIYETSVKEPIYEKDLLKDLNFALKNKKSKRSLDKKTFKSNDDTSKNSLQNKSFKISNKFKLMSKKEKTVHVSKLFGRSLHKSTMTGISYLIPLIVAGGILSALALLIAQIAVPSNVQPYTNPKTYKVYSPAWQYMKNMNGVGPEINISGLFKQISYYVFDIGIPVVLAGYVAFAIADRPGLVPGMIGGVLVSKFHKFTIYNIDLTQGGFVGGLFAGFVAGGVMYLLQMIKYHRYIKGLINLFIFPVFGSIITLLSVLFIFGPLASIINKGVTDVLKQIEDAGAGAAGLGFIVGSLMCIDMGGPINKATLAFAYAAMANQDETIYAAVAAAKITPEFVTCIATWLSPKEFTREEEGAGKFANPILGLAGITEGAIPFVLNDSKRVIPCTFLGGGIAGAISLGYGVHLNAIGAGVFSAAFMGGAEAGVWLLSIFLSSIISGFLLAFLKRVKIIKKNKKIKILLNISWINKVYKSNNEKIK